MNTNSKTNYIVKIALLGAIASVLMYLEFMIPFMPSFLTFDFSEIPVLLAAFALGPVAGIYVELIKNVVHLFGSHTSFIGEFANFIVGVCFVVSAAVIYKKLKNKKGAVISLIVGTICLAISAAILNYYLFIPLYQKVLGWPVDAIVQLGTKANPQIASLKTLILYGIIPFNLIKGAAISLIMMLIYKKISPLLHK